jgi:hypothetical protein
VAVPARAWSPVPDVAVRRSKGCACGGRCGDCQQDGQESQSSVRHSALLRLQRQAGNRAVTAIVQRQPGTAHTETDRVQHAASGETSAGTVSVTGQTNATYTHLWNPEPQQPRTAPSEDCAGGCPDPRFPCETASAARVSTYRVNATVALPRASDIAGLPDCERGVLQNWIDTILLAHENQHKAAYDAYGGTTRTRHTVTGCRDQVASMLTTQMDAAHRAEEQPRRAACDRASAALDPFSASLDFSPCNTDEAE